MSNSSLEDDLLNVVGITGKGGSQANTKGRNRRADSSSGEDEAIQKPGKGSPRRRKGNLSDDDDDEDDSISYGSDLIKDDEDKEVLGTMPELERELELHKRSEKRADYMRRKKLHDNLEVESKPSRIASQKGFSAGDKEERYKERRNLRESNYDRQNDSEARVDKARGNQEEYRDQRNRELEGASRFGTSGGKFEEKKPLRLTKYQRDELEMKKTADISSLRRIVLTRAAVVDMFFHPKFEKQVTGQLVRLGIGLDNNEQPKYRICEVVGLMERDSTRKYVLEDEFNTCKYLELKFGKHKKAFPATIISNQDPTELEFQEWFQELDSSNLPRLTNLDVVKRVNQRQDGRGSMTSDVIKKILEAKKAARIRPLITNLIYEHDRLVMERAKAENNGDMKLVEKLNQDIEEIERLRKEQSSKVDEDTLRLQRINEKNRLENVRNNKIASELKQTTVVNDPFARKWTESQNYYTFKSDKVSKEAEERKKLEAEEEEKRKKEEEEKKAEERKRKLEEDERERKRLTAGDILRKKHKFEVDFSLDNLQKWGTAEEGYMRKKYFQESRYGVKVGEVVEEKRMGTTLTINDYKRRRGLL